MYNTIITMRHSTALPATLQTRAAVCLILLVMLAGCASPARPTDIANTFDLRSTTTDTPIPTSTATFTNTPSPTATATRTPRPTRTPTSAPSRTSTPVPAGTLTPTPNQMPAGPFKAVLRLQEITPGLVSAIYILPDRDEILLAGTFGMTRIDVSTLEAFSTRYWGISLGLDSSGQAWALPPDGAVIAAWQDNNWGEYGLRDGWVLPARLPKTPVTSSRVVNGAQNTLWLATATDVRLFNGRTWSIYPATSTGIALPYKAGVESALTITTNTATAEAWAGSCNWRDGKIVGGGGLRYFDGRRWTDSGFPQPLACILSLRTAPDGKIWASSGSDLWRFDPAAAEWQPYSPPALPESQRYSHILDFVINPQGQACPLLMIEDEDERPRQQIRFCVEGRVWQAVRTLPAMALQELRFAPDGSLLSFEEDAVLRLMPDGVWQPLVEMDYDAFTVGPGADIWLVSQTETRPVVWRAEIPGGDN